ncbi:MAG TPA: FG-GAP-like repeat-containing protein [Candidatus Angelobacter sp.]
MTKSSVAIIFLSVCACLLTACSSGDKVPARSSPQYSEAVSTFYVGLAALQVGDDVHADSALPQFTQLAPGEPAGWANWGILALRQRDYNAAAQRMERAGKIVPENSQIHYLQGLLESERGNSAQALQEFRRAAELDTRDGRARYALAEEIERGGGDNSDADFQRAIEQILAADPDNLAALLELARIAAKRGDVTTLRSAVTKISSRSENWPPEVKQQLAALQAAIAGPDPRAAGTRTIFLRNVLVRVPEYRRDLSRIKPAPGEGAQPFTRFLKMETPGSSPAPADTSLAFTSEQLSGDGKSGNEKWDWVGAISLGITGNPVSAKANGHTVCLSSGACLPYPGGHPETPPGPESILPADLNYDFKTDLVLAGAGGVRLFRQESPALFTDVTAKTKLPKNILNGNYTGAWAVDIEADGDLDIVLGKRQGPPTVLRNNGDDTFSVIYPFSGISGLLGFAWADFDADGAPDAALIDGAGHLHVFTNERGGQFRERALPNLPVVKAITVADVNNDGVLDLVAVQADGAIVRLSDKDEGQAWDVAVIASVPEPAKRLAGVVRVRTADLDNNGAVDLTLMPVAPANGDGALIWLGDEKGGFIPLPHPVGPAQVFDVADMNGDGRLDLLGVDGSRQAVQGINHGSKNYHWAVVRPHAQQAEGDQRINPFGIGGQMEVRAGLLVQVQPITGPQIHFGLGEGQTADVVRVIWPNGSVRAEFAIKADQEVVTEQRLKGSCPFLFAFNGKKMEFVKDAVPWSSAIGLRINTIGTARVEATEEWYKIGGDELVPRDGYYDLRITAELWETYYYDYLALMTVDHPKGTDIFVDERFVIPPAKLQITAVESPHKIARAVDDNGHDVTEIVSKLDGKYLDTFGRGQYQGVTRDHYVEVDLGNDVPTEGPLWLIVKGWMHPTDSSINVAISQGHTVQARPLSLEVPDGHGGWLVARPNLGFPAGRKKICLIDLAGVFRPGTPHRVRLRTNLEVYWDSIEWARGLPETPLRITRLAPEVADLHYRGYSVINQPNSSSPEVPDYNHISGSKQIWCDLIGYYTRYGDVRELLARIDDRYVIMNAGDEMSFRFAAPPPPAEGWVRDYVIAGDGWIKDGDYNSTFSKTVVPLPYHAKQQYIDPPGRLEDEWVYRHHPEDWQNFQTRYITPDVFRNALRNVQ